MENYFEKQFELRYFEMNKFGEASPTTILALLEETAADHCYSINHSLYDLMLQNIGWVLVSCSNFWWHKREDGLSVMKNV